jgi:hypothetical protein
VSLAECIASLLYRYVGIAGRRHAESMAVRAICSFEVIEQAAKPTVVELVVRQCMSPVTSKSM